MRKAIWHRRACAMVASSVLLIEPGFALTGSGLHACWSVAADMTGVELALVAHDDSRVAALQRQAGLHRCSGRRRSPWSWDTPNTIFVSISRPRPRRRSGVTRVTLHRVKVPMRQLYVSAMYMRRTTERIIVELETADGMRGFGETNGTGRSAAEYRAHGE